MKRRLREQVYGHEALAVPFLLAHSWTTLEDVLATMCSDYLQRRFQLVAGTSHPVAGALGAHISLTDVEHEVRLDLTFFSPPGAARAIAVAFCGDPSIVDDGIVHDVLLELANSGMGAVKRAFSRDGFQFCGGAPRACVFGAVAPLLDGVEAERVSAFRSEDLLVHTVVTARHAHRTKVCAHALQEGMVVATDVVTADGALILSAGTRITEASAARVRRLAPKVEVEVADAVAEA